jgi:hypothetical protein
MLSIIRQDSDLNAFFSRQLEYVKATTYDIKYADLKARDFVPVSNEVNPGATNVTYRQWERSGRAKIISSNAKDIPRADVLAHEFTRPVREIALAYGFTLKETRAAAMAGENLDARKASSCRRGIEEVLDDVAALGSAADGIASGFLNEPNIAVTTLIGADDWQTLVGGGNQARIVEIISEAYQLIKGRTRGVEAPNTLLLPTAEEALISTTPFGDNSDKTIRDFLMANFRFLDAIESWDLLDDAGAGAVTRAVLYPRSDQILTQDIPSEFEQIPPQEQGLETVINCLASSAGTAVYYPEAIQFIDGV